MSSSPCTIREAIDVLSLQKLPSDDRPVDLLGAVASIVKSPPLQYAKSSSKVELWITDHSLSSGETACVVLWGSAELSRVEITRLEPGDVVRFNGVSLQKSLQQRQQQQGENITYYFTYSHKNEEPGMKWYAFNDRETSRIPDSMQTPAQRIQDLKEHYTREMGNGGRLSPLPCRFRHLNELQVSTGLMSNISIRVKQHELQQFTAVKTRRLTSSVTKSVVGFATVADSAKPDLTMTLVDTDNRFANDLREARDTNKVLMINNVFTRKQSEVLGDNSVVGEVVLVPSKNSIVNWEWKTDDLQQQQHHSMPSTLETESPGYKLQKSITSLACLVDIEISGKLLNASKCLESPTCFVQGMIITSEDQQEEIYRPVTLHLESSTSSSSTIPCPREVLASPAIIQTLCGGIDAKELTHDELLQKSVFDLVQAMLRDQVKLKWTIRMDCQPFAVEHVVLPSGG
ncbi:unnamed protein product [Cylindrotheca closterium]|uniref:Uncharacterized protein n=1 Tax=Cylindrotheca closterium TaxID=2856 RepID=A0AAD2CBH2_9STRA|nr:unnamed protein product [Cylindrotheca closterium]